MVSVLLPTMVSLHGILCNSHSDINMNMIASSELWKLICFLSINELNTTVIFCYFHTPAINTTLVIKKFKTFTLLLKLMQLLCFSVCFMYGLLDTLVCALLKWAKMCYHIYFTACLFCFYVLGLFYYVSPLCICIVIATCSV